MKRCVLRSTAGEVVAALVEGNPLAEPDAAAWAERAVAAAAGVPGRRVVAWSGTLASKGLFERDPRTWMRPGHEALRSFCDSVRGALLHSGTRLALRPHARHVLSDPASCQRFLDETPGGPFELALAPASLLEPALLDAAEDHLERAFSLLAGRAALILLHDVSVRGDDLVPVPLGEGVLPPDAMQRLVAAHVPEQTPVVLLE